MADIEVKQITKKFGNFTAVDGVSFSVEHGEIFALLGPNGAGKSTLIRMLTTLIPATGGTATICGHDVVKEADAVRRVIGVIPQAMTSDLELSVEENLLIYAKLYGVPRERRRRLMCVLLRGRRRCRPEKDGQHKKRSDLSHRGNSFGLLAVKGCYH